MTRSDMRTLADFARDLPPLPPARWESLVERDQGRPRPRMRGPVNLSDDPSGVPCAGCAYCTPQPAEEANRHV